MTFRECPRRSGGGPVLRSRRRRLSRLLVAALILAANLFVAGFASAQAAITVVNEASLPRLDKNGNTIGKRSQNLTPEGVNLQDCLDDESIRFTLQMAGFEPNGSIQQWASNSGADCKDTLARSGGTQTCWQLGPNIPLQLTVDVNIPVRKIMSGAPPFGAQKTNATIEACGQVDLSTITVHFLYFAPGNSATASTDKAVNISVDTVGPAPPGGLSALPGNTQISVQWASISGGGDSGATGGVTALTGVRVYCDVAGDAVTTTAPAAPICTDTTIDASPNDSGDAEVQTAVETTCVDGGTTTSTAAATCASTNFVKADGTTLFPDATFEGKYACGSINGNSGTTVVANSIAGSGPLVNGTRYAVAVAATDAYGNAGPLSSVVCETPAVTTDFWDEYRNANGKAGGGCATGGEELPLGSLSALGVVLALSMSLARRRSLKERNR